MEVFKWILWVAYFLVIWTVNETIAHPKSWLTTAKPRPKPKRSVTELDVTFYPGLTLEFKDSLRIEELGKFLKEEETEEEGDEEVIIRLLQEEREQSTEEPIEFATQKRVIMQLKTPLTQFQESMETFEFPSENTGLDSLSDDTGRIKPIRNYLESTTAHHETIGPEINNLPQEIFTRLQSIEQIPSSEEPYDPSSFSRQNIDLHRDTDVNYLHRKDFNDDNSQSLLLRRLLNHQKQNTKDNLKFLNEDNEEEGNINNIHKENVEPDSTALSEAQLDWEEYHEDDA